MMILSGFYSKEDLYREERRYSDECVYKMKMRLCAYRGDNDICISREVMRFAQLNSYVSS